MDESMVIDGLDSSFEVHVHTEPEADNNNNTKERRTYICDQCSKSFLTKWGMKLHQRTIHEKKFRWQCLVCQKGFNTLYNYKGHLASHDRMFRKKCAECTETFQYHSSYLEHMKHFHHNEQYICNKSECGRSFASPRALREHVRATHDGVNVICKVCGKAYKWRSSLQYHVSKCHVTENN